MLGIWLGKLIAFILRLRGHNATSLPGKLALRVSPHLIKKLGSQLERCIVVTGTNGKTTTTSFLASIIGEQEPVITNAEGANLTQGIATSLLLGTTLLGRVRAKTAILEIDEATFPLVAADLPIQMTIVTNVFRDQLDRYGELDTTLQKIMEGIQMTSGSLLLNADDPLAAHIGLHSKNQVHYFGMSSDNRRVENRRQMRDGAFCLECGNELDYEYFIYGQLGQYKCPKCDFCRPTPDILGSYTEGGLTLYRVEGEENFSLPTRGLFNVYNALAAICAAVILGVSCESIGQGMKQFRAPTGRMQVFDTDPSSILNLIKNPTGCDSVLQAICMESSQKVICIAINDQAADGRDVSWLWDADFELLAETASVTECITTGFRAEDMALRLKYAGFPPLRIKTDPFLETAIDMAISLGQSHGNIPVYVMTTYTLLHTTADYLHRKVVNHVQAVENRTSIS